MRLLLLLGLTAVLAASSGGASASSSSARRVGVSHGLSILVPPGWRISPRHFMPCSDPVERFSLLGAGQILTLEERLVPVRAEPTRRPRHFNVRGEPTPLECCAIPGHRGWVVQFGDHGRAFYAYLYPGRGSARILLRTLESLLVA